MRAPAVLLFGLVLGGCTTLRSPAPPEPGPNPTVFPVGVETALSAISDSFQTIRDVESLRRPPGAPQVTFDYLRFQGRILLVCLRGEEGRTGWWPSVTLGGTRIVFSPWRIARLLAFYARLTDRAEQALADASGLALRIRQPEVVEDSNCP